MIAARIVYLLLTLGSLSGACLLLSDTTKIATAGAENEAVLAVTDNATSRVDEPEFSTSDVSEDILLEQLQRDTPRETKRTILNLLRLHGSQRAVPFIAQMLSDTNLSHEARSVLDVIPGQIATAALVRAAHDARRDQLIGIIATLGNRGSHEAVQTLVTLLADREVSVVRAAVSALGKIGNDRAIAALESVACEIDPPLFTTNTTRTEVKLAPQVKYRLGVAVVLDALLDCAEQLAQQGQTAAAAQLCVRIAASEVAPWPGRVAAITQLARFDPAQSMKFVLSMLREKDESIQAVGASFARVLPSDALEALVSVLPACPIQSQIGVVNAVADRGKTADLPVIIKALRFPELAVRETAARALTRFQPSSEAVLELARLAGSEGRTSDMAIEVFGSFPGREIDGIILASLETPDELLRVGLFRAACVRGCTAALPFIISAASTNSPLLRRVAIESLGQLGSQQEFELLRNFLRSASDPTDITLIARSLVHISKRIDKTEDAARLITSIIPSVDKTTKLALYQCLGTMGGVIALSAVRQAVNGSDQEIRDHALDLLTKWPDASPLDDLLAIAKTADSFQRHSIAIRGYIKLVERPSSRTREQTFELYKQALEVALFPEDKKLVFPALVRLGYPGSVQLLENFLAMPELRDEAARNLALYAGNLISSSPSEALQIIAQLKRTAQGSNLSADLEHVADVIAKIQHSIHTWELAGPYTAPLTNTQELAETPFPPEEKTVPVQWTGAQHQEGFVRLTGSGEPNEVVYARTSIASPREQLATLYLLTSNPCRAWLNGQPVEPEPSQQITQHLQRVAPVRLKKGDNQLVLKAPLLHSPTVIGCYLEQTTAVPYTP